ncbi:hypothetical protein L3137_14040 [Bacillus sonorensis]|uniref:hypothetical protein n=1 Tax=Bacillus sonorensis TaxID=119858 RepID=UPI001F2A9692|nr:hypothetical protein [Bacillus sonorensis]MCF7618385.1 hypothetical protein [Bacillus sonorensis]
MTQYPTPNKEMAKDLSVKTHHRREGDVSQHEINVSGYIAFLSQLLFMNESEAESDGQSGSSTE